MVGLFDFLFVRRSFLSVKHSKNIQKSDINIFGLVPYCSEKIINVDNGRKSLKNFMVDV